jgi:hypothetical protein
MDQPDRHRISAMRIGMTGPFNYLLASLSSARDALSMFRTA